MPNKGQEGTEAGKAPKAEKVLPNKGQKVTEAEVVEVKVPEKENAPMKAAGEVNLITARTAEVERLERAEFFPELHV